MNSVKHNHHPEVAQKILISLTCLYISLILASYVLAHNLIKITDTLVINSSALCYSFTYFINDIITELYGFNYGRFTIWAGIAADWIFTWLIIGVITLPHPNNYPLAIQYHAVLYPMARIPIIELPSSAIGRFINIYFLAKTKVLLNSRFFWLRSISSSCVGAVIHTMVNDFFIWVGIVGYSTLVSIIVLNSLANVFILAFLSWIPLACVYFIKNKLGIDQFNYKEKFNPFAL